EQAIQATDERSRLLAAARAMVLKGERKFSISRLCSQAGLPRAAFAEYFSSRTELMAELMADAAAAPEEAVVEIAIQDCGEDGRETFEAASEPAAEAPVQLQPAERAPIETLAQASTQTPVQAPRETRGAEALPKAAFEPSVSTPDAWLERRLRVFERALSALEAKAETKEREQARLIAELEEKLAQLQGATGAPRA